MSGYRNGKLKEKIKVLETRMKHNLEEMTNMVEAMNVLTYITEDLVKLLEEKIGEEAEVLVLDIVNKYTVEKNEDIIK